MGKSKEDGARVDQQEGPPVPLGERGGMRVDDIQQVDLFVDEAERLLIEKCLDRRWLSEGPYAQVLREKIGALLGVKHVMFAPNGTLGLFLASLGLDLEPGSEIVIPSFTFYGTATACVYAGLKPVFIDADPKTFNSSADDFRKAITPRTRAFMPVHIYGQMGEMNEIMDVAREHGIKVIEDAAQALSVNRNGKFAGTFGDIGVFSLFSDKVITTGEGGVVVTNDSALSERLSLIRNQGRPNAGTFLHPALGMNFRITDLQAAVGLAQLEKLGRITADRTRKWEMYTDGLSGIGDITFMERVPGSTLIPFRFPILTHQRDKLMQVLEANGIQTRGFFYPMHLQPKFIKDPPDRLPVAEDLHSRGICLPIHYQLTDAQVGKIIDVIRQHFG